MNVFKLPEPSTDATKDWLKWGGALVIALVLGALALGVAAVGVDAASQVPLVGAFFDRGSGGDGSGTQVDDFGVPHFN